MLSCDNQESRRELLANAPAGSFVRARSSDLIRLFAHQSGHRAGSSPSASSPIFSAHESLVCFFIRELQKNLPCFGWVTLNQLQAADRDPRAAGAAYKGGPPGPDKLPLDDHLAKVLMAAIYWILMPARLGGKSAHPVAEDLESFGDATAAKKAVDVPAPPPAPERQPERKKLTCLVPRQTIRFAKDTTSEHATTQASDATKVCMFAVGRVASPSTTLS